jgi:uncharacterized protein YjbI with pentapeptide repeats
MKQFRIQNRFTRDVLFKGRFSSFAACLEAAVAQGCDLTGADLRHKNLINASLDTAYMPQADLSYSNLSGANLSEGCLRGAVLRYSALFNVCFCYSDLRSCDFSEAHFGGTDISGCDISQATFSALSCFDLDFWHTARMEGCHYLGLNGRMSMMNTRPVVLKGLMHQPIIILDEDVHIGAGSFPRRFLPGLLDLLERRAPIGAAAHA